MKKIAVLYHQDADGFSAAYAAWFGLYVCAPVDQERPEMKFIPVQYGQEPPLAELSVFDPDDIYIVDFSYDPEILIEMTQFFRSITVIDHHKTAAEKLKDLQPLANLKIIFDMNLSGAVLTWQQLVPQFPVPEILRYVQDRDLWRFELPMSKEVNAYIAQMPKDFTAWSQFDLDESVFGGTAILNFQKMQIQKRLKDVKFIELAGHTVPCVNASENISELGNEMCKAYPESPFSVSYCDRADGNRSYSLRSIGEFDVSEVAKARGGGGHSGSSGFCLPSPPRI